MNIKNKFNIANFEAISETIGNKLIGGFSASIAASEDPTDNGGETSNNCQGGNCRSTCGTGQNVQCNTVANCAG